MSKIYVDLSSLSNPKNNKAAEKADGFLGFDYNAFLRNTVIEKKSDGDSDVFLRNKRAWDLATGPAKTLAMQMFMSWMSGSSVQIFSILITGMVLMTPIKAIMSIGSVFEPLEHSRISGEADINLFIQKLIFLMINTVGIIFGLYRLAIMGLLPTTTSDWLNFALPKTYSEYSLH
ncbi:hypothetical protein BB559_002445 [Furculomyces boomerangus]|uniref:ER membrane protein complex subunit 4 n=2 Tax=Harpellales TaxID=61421 RepID=A0A2T9YCP5_9FUNG|nr:hypothetical protein BB559_004779 [Furculomyces boomerangus]PVU91505.1 hypothetical protein BB559_004093 [Furculomyces boomerangus]PVU96282.1 hypothetical protein BB559_002445 [Furculomyces boomerangus]PVZ97436.1 hypothetical protein BB558_006593 [Smittium angustum]PVZ99329.1 hypothetical protein BB558_004671 [Smittium angustum]